MSGTAGAWLLLGMVVCAANIPFVFNRVLFVFRGRDGGSKSFGWRVLELLMLYLAMGAMAMQLEVRNHGAAYAQGWEFYATTGCLFVVFAFPGFVYRYLWRHAVPSDGASGA